MKESVRSLNVSVVIGFSVSDKGCDRLPQMVAIRARISRAAHDNPDKLLSFENAHKRTIAPLSIYPPSLLGPRFTAIDA